MASLHPGELLDNRFELVSIIGSGGMSDVWEARDRFPKDGGSDQTVAVKVLHDSLVQSCIDPTSVRGAQLGQRQQTVVQRLAREGTVLSQLNHPNIARFIAGGETANGLPYLVMEYLDGVTLDRELEHARQQARRCVRVDGGTRPLDPRERDGQAAYPAPLMSYRDIYLIGEEMLRGAAYLHGLGLSHRDFKPSNIMLERDRRDDNRPRNVKLLDFGIVKVAESVRAEFGVRTTLTHVESMMGTPNYMSPEQIMCTAHVDAQTDVYAIGLILFEMITGLRPFAAASKLGEVIGAVVTMREPYDPSLYVRNVPAELCDVTVRATVPTVKDRYPNAIEMLAAFQEAKTAAFNYIGTTEAVDMRPMARPSRSVSGLGSLVLAGAGALVVGGVGTYLLASPFMTHKLPARAESVAASASVRSPMTAERVPPKVPKALNAEPMSETAKRLYDLGEAYMKRQRYRLALQTFQDVLDIAPNAPEVYDRLAECHEKLGNRQDAVLAQQKARSLRDGN